MPIGPNAEGRRLMPSPPHVTVNVGASPEFDPISYALAALILAACAVLAWRRSRFSPAQEGQHRWRRVAISSGSFAAAVAIMMLLPANEGANGSLSMVLAISMFAFILCGVAAFLVISLIELAVWRARASRSRVWLIAAPLIFAVAFTGLGVVPGLALGQGFSGVLGWDLLQFLALSTGAGLIWWSHLPTLPAEVGQVFE
jgi:hypothetical protein